MRLIRRDPGEDFHYLRASIWAIICVILTERKYILQERLDLLEIKQNKNKTTTTIKAKTLADKSSFSAEDSALEQRLREAAMKQVGVRILESQWTNEAAVVRR